MSNYVYDEKEETYTLYINAAYEDNGKEVFIGNDFIIKKIPINTNVVIYSDVITYTMVLSGDIPASHTITFDEYATNMANLSDEQLKDITDYLNIQYNLINANENTFFTILFSYGIIMAIMYILFWIELYLENVRSYKKIKKFYLMKQIIFGQVLLYSLVLPIKFSFPMNILYILSLKLDKKY